MPRRWKILPIAGLLVLVALGGARWAAPSWARQRILSRLSEACPQCRFEVHDIDLGLIGERFIMRGVEVRTDPGKRLRIVARVEGIRLDLRLWSLIERELWVRSLRIDGVDLDLVENESVPSGPASSGDWLGEIPSVHIEKTQVRGGRFAYELEKKGQRALIRFHDIEADAGPFGTRRAQSAGYVETSLSARQGHDAEVRIHARIGLFENADVATFRISVRNARLKDANTYFVPGAGMRIQGRLERGSALLELRNQVLRCRLTADYRDLDVDFLPSGSAEGALGAFFKNAMAKLSVKEGKPEEGRDAALPEVEVRIARKPGQDTVGFLLDGLEKASEKLVTR